MADKANTAVGLKYVPETDRAPEVVAKGKRKVAEQIIATARENNIPVYEDPAIVELLYRLELHQQIPEELYVAVAEILAFVYRLDGSFKSS